jgi:hypothetical protein
MKPGQHKPADELRMSSKEFDKIMGRALQVHPKEPQNPERSGKAKAKAARSKK